MLILFSGRSPPDALVQAGTERGWVCEFARYDEVASAARRRIPNAIVLEVSLGVSPIWAAVRRDPQLGTIPVVLRGGHGLTSLGMLWHAWSHGDELLFVPASRPTGDGLNAIEAAVRAGVRPLRGRMVAPALASCAFLLLVATVAIASLVLSVLGAPGARQARSAVAVLAPLSGVVLLGPLFWRARMLRQPVPFALTLFLLLWLATLGANLLR